MKSQAYGLKGDKENQIENGHCACEKKFRNHLSSVCFTDDFKTKLCFYVLSKVWKIVTLIDYAH